MAKELKVAHTKTGKSLYALIFNSAGQVWDTTGTPAFATYATANIANYDVALTEQGTASRIYMGDFPSGINTAEDYSIVVFERLGGSPAEGDLLVATGRLPWAATEEASLAQTLVTATDTNADVNGGLNVNVASVDNGAITASAFEADAINSTVLADNAITAGKLEPTAAAEIADAVWDEALSGHTTTGSAGKALADAAVAGDPWNVALPGAYGSGTAGKIVGDNINATISSRAAASDLVTVAGYLDTEIAAILADTDELQTDWTNSGRLDLLIDAIKAKTDNLPGSPAATGDAMTLTSGERDSIAAALLDLANGVETSTTTRQALRLILAALVGKLSGAETTTVVIRDINDAKDRITATVDEDGNRTAVTTDPT